MKDKDEYFDEDFTEEEREEFEEKFCHGTLKATILSDEEIEQLKKEGRI